MVKGSSLFEPCHRLNQLAAKKPPKHCILIRDIISIGILIGLTRHNLAVITKL